MDAIDRIRDTAESHGRVFFVEVMGRDSGYIGLYAGLAGGAEGILIPEKGNQFDVLIKQYEQKSRKKEFSIYVVAEGDEEGKALELSHRFMQHYPQSDTRVVVLGHIQRGGKPTASDRILASRLGAHAVKGLTEGLSNCAVGVIRDEIVYTSFEEAIKGKKELNNNLWILNEMICR
jgi:6-phosphofructokinase 1